MALLLQALVLCISLFINSVTTNMYFDRIEILSDTYVEGVINISLFRINKLNRTTYVMNSEVESFVDVDGSYSLEMSFFYNRLNNNQYYKTMMRVPKISFCDIYDKYSEDIMEQVKKNITNIYSPSGKCPLKKVTIWAEMKPFQSKKNDQWFYFAGTVLDPKIYFAEYNGFVTVCER